MQMQTPKTSTKSSFEGTRKISPRSISSSRVVRQLKTSGIEPNSSSNQSSPKTTKIIDRTSPRSPVPEVQKKRVGRVVELETQITQLEDALRTVKDQLILSESWKKQAKEDAEESRKQLLAMSLKLEESQQLLPRSSSEETQGIKKQNSTDSAALAAALLEIDQLKVKLNTLTKSEATQTKQAESANTEIHILKQNIADTLSQMDEMKNQLKDCKNSESQAQNLTSQTLLQLETAKMTIESLKSKNEYNAIVLELDESRAHVNALKRESAEIISLKSGEIMELKANLIDKETELQAICEENDDLNTKMANLISGKQENEVKIKKMEKELCDKLDENEKLKVEMKKMEARVAGVIEQLEAVQMENCEMEGELRRMKVQMDQWRKAAEAATDMLCNENTDNDNNTKMTMERTWTMENYSDDDEFLKKKNGNVLRRIGVLWKKPQSKGS